MLQFPSCVLCVCVCGVVWFGLSTENQYLTHPQKPFNPALELANPMLVIVSGGSLPLEPVNGGSVGGFSPSNPKKPDWTKEHFSVKGFRFGEILAISYEILARSLKSPLDLVRSHWIWWDFAKSSEFLVKISPKFCRFRCWLVRFWWIFRSRSLTAIRRRLD